jgi:ubiquinone/menaquinone biosynthesis C-methylase UbiE
MTASTYLNLPNAIDWNDIWNQELINHWKVYGKRSGAGQWYSKAAAQQYWDRAQKNHRQRIENIIQDLNVSPSSRILDIGAGPGIISIPLSGKVSHITAVDPSPGMISVLKEKMSEQGITNIHYLEKYWEDIQPTIDLMPPYDIVIASLSLDMLNIQPALKKMDNICSKAVYLYWFAGEPTWETHTRNLMPLLHGITYSPLPKCDILFNVLYRMGIYPHISKSTYHHIEQYNSREEALDHYKSYYHVSTPEQIQVLKNYLTAILQQTNDGLISTSQATCLKIWWEKDL